MFVKNSGAGFRRMNDGIEMRTLAYGDSMLMVAFHLIKGHELALHSHPAEQTGYLLSGHIRLSFGGQEHDILPGDSWSIPGGTEHGGEILEDSMAVEVFSPVREEYLT